MVDIFVLLMVDLGQHPSRARPIMSDVRRTQDLSDTLVARHLVRLMRDGAEMTTTLKPQVCADMLMRFHRDDASATVVRPT